VALSSAAQLCRPNLARRFSSLEGLLVAAKDESSTSSVPVAAVPSAIVGHMALRTT